MFVREHDLAVRIAADMASASRRWLAKWSRRRTAQCLKTVCLAVPVGDHGAGYLIGGRTKFSASSPLGATSSRRYALLS